MSYGLRAGDVIADRYEIIHPVAGGGMGVVYAARRLALDDTVAVKCIHPDQETPTARARFVREARAMARIRHPNVVQVFDFGDTEGEPAYLVMELLRGPSLAKLVESGPIPAERAMSMFSDICAAVEAGHRRGVVHRDIKPGNVVLSGDDDGGQTVKVLDFGLARLVGATDDDPVLTKVGSLVGTVAYMSPEQIEGGDAGTASDVWALGVMLYELVTGRLPFSGRSAVAAIMKISEVDYDDPRTHVPTLPPVICDAIDRALQRDEASRPATPMELCEGFAVPLLRHSAVTGPLPLGTTSAGEPDTQVSDAESSVTHVSVHGLTRGEGGTPASVELIGRDHVFDALEDELLTAAERSACRFMVVRSEPGLGKSAVLERFLQRHVDGASIVAGRFYAYEGDRPPAAETFWWMLRARDEGGIGGRPLTVPPTADGHDKWRGFEELARRFAELTETRPLILALDEIQWASGLELEFLGYLFRALERRPALILTAARSAAARTDARTDLSAWMLKFARQHPGRLASLSLDAFDDEQVYRWLCAKLGRVRVLPTDVRRLRKLTGGNPAYLDEVLRHLRAHGAVTDEGEVVHVRVDDEAELPESVAQAALANVEDLDAAVRDVVEAASVVGEEFRFETLEATTRIAEDELERHLERACRHGILSERGTSAGADYRFSSPAVRAALYESITKRRRRRLHRSVVEALESLYARELPRIARVLCVHHHATRNWQGTVRHGLIAIEASLAAFDADGAAASLARVRDALTLIEEGGDTVDPAEVQRVRLFSGIHDNRIGRAEAAVETLAPVVAEAAAAGQAGVELRASLELAEARLGLGDLAAARDTAARALELAAGGDAGVEARARVLLGSVEARLGRYEAAETVLAPVVASEDTGLARQRALALRERAWVETRRGDMQAADVLARRALAIAEANDDPLARYFATSVLAVAQSGGGDPNAALEGYEEALTMARALSLRRREMFEIANAAATLKRLGRLDEALTHMLQARALCEELGDRASLGDCMVTLAQVLVARGDLDEAVDSFERGRALADEAGRVEYALIATLELGDVELRRGRPQRALAFFSDALERLQSVESLHEWRAYYGIALALDMTDGPQMDVLMNGTRAWELIDVLLSNRIEGEDELLNSASEALAELDRRMEQWATGG